MPLTIESAPLLEPNYLEQREAIPFQGELMRWMLGSEVDDPNKGEWWVGAYAKKFTDYVRPNRAFRTAYFEGVKEGNFDAAFEIAKKILEDPLVGGHKEN